MCQCERDSLLPATKKFSFRIGSQQHALIASTSLYFLNSWSHQSIDYSPVKAQSSGTVCAERPGQAYVSIQQHFPWSARPRSKIGFF